MRMFTVNKDIKGRGTVENIEVLIEDLERRLQRQGVALRGVVVRDTDRADKMVLIVDGEILGVVKLREYSPAQRQN